MRISAVVDKRIVNNIGDKTAILRKYDMSTKIVCYRHNVLFWKRKDTFNKQYIVKISLQKGLTVCKKRAFKRLQRHALRSAHHCLPRQSRWSRSRSSKYGFWSEHHCINLFPDHCVVDNCRCRDEIWPDMSTKKSVLDDSTNFHCSFFDEFVMKSWKIFLFTINHE